MKFKGIIESHELKKSGETNGKAWHIYEMFVGGTKFSTFDATYGDHVGEELEFEYEERENNGFKNLTAKNMDWKPSKADLLEERVARLEIQMGNVLSGNIKPVEAPVNPAPTVSPETVSPSKVTEPDEISIEDIPF